MKCAQVSEINRHKPRFYNDHANYRLPTLRLFNKTPVEIAIWVANYTLACNTALSLCRGTSILFKTLQPRILNQSSLPTRPIASLFQHDLYPRPLLSSLSYTSPPLLPSQTHPFQPHPSNPISNTNQDRRQPYQKPTLPFLSFFLAGLLWTSPS